MAEDPDIDYCCDLIVSDDPDIALALPYAADQENPNILSGAAAIYAFAMELRRIPAAVSEPPLGEIRLQWWRDALDEIIDGKTPRAHPVVATLARSGVFDASNNGAAQRARAERAIDARARPLYDSHFKTPVDLKSFFDEAEGPIAAMAFVHAGGSEDAAPLIEKLACACALARWARHICDDPDGEVTVRLVRQIRTPTLDRAQPALNAAPASAIGAILHLGLGEGYVRRRSGAVWNVMKRARLAYGMATTSL